MTQAGPRTLPSNRETTAWIEAWAFAPELIDLVVAFGGEEPGGRDVHAWLDYLEGFSERWDFRRGVERNLVPDQELAAELADRVLAAAQSLGLRGMTAPSKADYDLVVILGGLVRACLARPRYAASLLADGRVSVRGVVGLGGSRPLGGDEFDLVARLLDASVDNEFGAMDAGVRAAFELAGAPDAVALDGALAASSYHTAGGLPVHVVAAPPLDAGRTRANTADTYVWLASQSGLVSPGARLLLITTAIYVPYQHADALRMLALPYGIEVETVGIEPGDVDSRLAQSFAPHNYLQEMRSTIRSLRMLSG